MQEKNENTVLNEFDLLTERLALKRLDSSYYKPVLDYYLRNDEHFKLAMPEYPKDFFTEEYWVDRLWNEFNMALDGAAVRFYIFLKADGELERVIGDISLALILRGTAESCKLGYKLDKDFTGRGFMSEALKAVVSYVFDDLKLNRIEANIVPSNTASLNLIRKMRFSEEGIAYKYLKINGRWEDHLRFSMISPYNS